MTSFFCWFETQQDVVHIFIYVFSQNNKQRITTTVYTILNSRACLCNLELTLRAAPYPMLKFGCEISIQVPLVSADLVPHC
jgi:hypothetical protein